MRWEPEAFQEHGEGRDPVVVLRGVGWRAVARYLEKFGGELAAVGDSGSGSPSGPSRQRVLAEVSGKGWKARLHEEVEFTGALRTNRVEVSFTGEPEAVQQVVAGLRGMIHLQGA